MLRFASRGLLMSNSTPKVQSSPSSAKFGIIGGAAFVAAGFGLYEYSRNGATGKPWGSFLLSEFEKFNDWSRDV
jgi:hypothetical protein